MLHKIIIALKRLYFNLNRYIIILWKKSYTMYNVSPICNTLHATIMLKKSVWLSIYFFSSYKQLTLFFLNICICNTIQSLTIISDKLNNRYIGTQQNKKILNTLHSLYFMCTDLGGFSAENLLIRNFYNDNLKRMTTTQSCNRMHGRSVSFKW